MADQQRARDNLARALCAYIRACNGCSTARGYKLAYDVLDWMDATAIQGPSAPEPTPEA